MKLNYPVSFKDIGKLIEKTEEVKDDKQLRKKLKELDNEISMNIQNILKQKNIDLILCSLMGIENENLKNIEIIQKIGEHVFGILDTVMASSDDNEQLLINSSLMTFEWEEEQQNIENESRLEKEQKERIELVMIQKNMLKYLIEITEKVEGDGIMNQDKYMNLLENSVNNIILNKQLLEEHESMNRVYELVQRILEIKKDNNIQNNIISIIYESSEDNKQVESMVRLMYYGFNHQSMNVVNMIQSVLELLVQYMLERTNVSTEQQSIKNVAEFMKQLSEKDYKLFNNSLQRFIQLYDSEAYQMRNCVNEIIFQIIKNSEQRENSKNQKVQLIHMLIRRINDRYVHCRSGVLGILLQLSEKNLIPQEILLFLFENVIERVHDISTLVRRKAMQLINQLIQIFKYFYVESQQKKQFYNLNEIKAELNLVNNDIQETEQLIIQQDKQLREMEEDQEQEFDILKAKQDQLRKKEKSLQQLGYKLNEYQSILKIINNIVPYLIKLLQSKSQYDCIEAIRLLVLLNKQGIEYSEQGIKKMLVLIWNKDDKEQKNQIREEVINAYYDIYFKDNSYTNISNNLVKFIKEGSVKEKASIEELIIQIINKHKELKQNLFLALWDNFFKTDNNKEQKRAVICLIKVFLEQDYCLIDKKMYMFHQLIQDQINSNKVDWFLMKQIALIVQTQKKCFKEDQANEVISRCLIFMLIRNVDCQDDEYYIGCQKILDMVFETVQRPELTGQYIINKLGEIIVKEEKSQNNQKRKTNNNFETILARTIFVVGHVSLKILIEIDEIENNLRSMKNEKEKEEQFKQDGDNELDLIQGGLEAHLDNRIQQLKKIIDTEVVQGNLIGQYSRIIVQICERISNGERGRAGSQLDKASIIGLSKMMCVSKQFCSDNIKLFIGLLNSDIDESNKKSLIISLGDLLKRFPNVVESCSRSLFQFLNADDQSLKKTALMVITHLILNDMLKVKSEISEFAYLYNDNDDQIQNLVKIFFYELNKKDNKIIYNLLPDMISKLCLRNDFTSQMFENFTKSIMVYLEQDKYSENLVNKLTNRIKNTNNQKEVINSSYCIGLLSFNERAIKKLIENFDLYRDQLEIPKVNENFRNLIQKIKKQTKLEIKMLISEFEELFNNYKTAQVDKNKFQKKSKQPKNNKKNKKLNKKQWKQNESEKDESMDENDYMESIPSNNDGNQEQIRKSVRNQDRILNFLDEE